MKKIYCLIIAAALSLVVTPTAMAASTDGTANFNVTFVNPPGGYNARVDAFWITDASNRFIKNIRKDSGTRQGFLYYWASVRANTVIDGYSAATITSWTPITATWDCRDANEVVMADGTYKFWVEFTDYNGQGWYTTNGIAFTKGTAAVNQSYPNAGSYLTAMSVNYTPIVTPHDVAATAMSPSTAIAGTTVPVQVTVVNRTVTPETVSVSLNNVTSGTAIGTQSIQLAANATTTVTFQWNTAGLTAGSYSLRATAGPVTGETLTTDNTFNSTFTLQPQPHDIAVTGLAPSTVQANTTANMQITVLNRTATTESFSVILSNATTSAVIGTQSVNSLAGNQSTTVTIPWNTASLQGNYQLRAIAVAVAGETSTADNALTATIAVQLIPHDIAVTGITPTVVQPNSTATISVGVANRTTSSETFTVVLDNVTSGTTRIGTAQTITLAGNASTTLNFQWNTAGLSGNYSLRATAGPVAQEVATADNTLTATVAVRAPVRDVAVANIVAPSVVSPNSTATITVAVSNPGETVESFGVQLFDDTAGSAIGTTYQVNNLAAGGSANATFTWNTTGAAVGNHTLRATAAQVTGETATANNTRTAVVSVQSVTRDVAITGITAPEVVSPNGSATVTVTAANLGQAAETFDVQLFDDTASQAIGTASRVSNLAAGATFNVPFTWTTVNATVGNHTLRAVATTVSGETVLNNNSRTALVPVASGLASQTFIAKGSSWRYNDQGLDLSRTPWPQPDYYDVLWTPGAAPLGYSANNQLTGLNTRLSWGTSAADKYPAYYFRREFYCDAQPTALTLNLRYVDGAVVYFNGFEVARLNMPSGLVYFTDRANEAVVGDARYAFFTIPLAVTNVVAGRNVVAVEVHRADPAGADLAFDLELTGTVPQSTATHKVDAVAIETPSGAVVGDQMPVSVTVNNRGSATETVIVVLRNDTTGQIIGTQTLNNLIPGSSATAQFSWGTLGSANGANNLSAFTVINGVTNFAGSFTANAALSPAFSTTVAVNTRAGIGGRSAEVATTSNLLLVGAGATLEVYTRTNPTAPVKLGAVRLPDVIQSIAATDSRAIVACGQAGVQFVDLSSPSRPAHRSTFNTSGHAYAVALNGNYVYIADGVAGVRVVNAANLSAPTLAGAYYTRGPARAIAFANSRLYVLDQQEGLVILSLSSAGAPTRLGAYANFDAGQALAVAGSYAYLVDGNNHLAIVNVSSPAAPVLTGSLLLPNVVAQGIAVSGTTLQIAAGTVGVVTVNAGSPSAPTITSTRQMSGEVSDVAIAGSTLYVASGMAGFQICSLSTPSQPALQADFPVALRAADVAITNETAYVASGEAGLRILSLADPSAPRLLGRFTGVSNARAVAISGTRAYVGDGSGVLRIINVANAASPSLVTSYANQALGSIRDVGVSGSYVVLSDGRTVVLLNLSRSGSLRFIGTYQTPGFAFSMAVDKSQAYLACGNAGLVILKLGNNALTRLATFKLPGLASGVAASGNSVYVAGPGTGYWRVDVTNPSSPALNQTYSGQGGLFELALSGTNLALVTMTNSLVTMNVTAPLTPVPTQYFGPLARAVRLATTTRLTLIAEDEAGLALFGPASSGGDDDDSYDDDDAYPDKATTENAPLSIADLMASAAATPGSAFVLAVPATIENSGFTLRWHSETGKTYTIYRSTDLNAGFTVLKDNIQPTPPMNVETDAMTSGSAFYVIGVR